MSSSGRKRLITPDSSPYQYDILLRDADCGNGSSAASIVVVDRTNASAVAPGELQANVYQFSRGNHKSYLDLFSEFARDLGLRHPLNRQPTDPTFSAKYDLLLGAKDQPPGVLYGFGDPAVLRTDRDGCVAYYMVCTSNDAPASFPIFRSEDLSRWDHLGFVFPHGNKPPWVLDGVGLADFWAPELHQIKGEFRVYFTARHRDTGDLCIGEARSAQPEGPFVGGAEPILRGGVIDPHILVDDDGRAYLYWKEDNNGLWPGILSGMLHRWPSLIGKLFLTEADRRSAAFTMTLWPWVKSLDPMEQFFAQQNLVEAVTSEFSAFESRATDLLSSERDQSLLNQLRNLLRHLKTPVFVSELSDDGESLVGEPARVLENDQAWEAHVVEGIWVMKEHGRYFMFYAGNDFSTAGYGINFAVSDSPRGPFRKSPEPVLRTTPEWMGPGHCSVAKGLKHEYVLFLHAFQPGRAGYKQFRAFLSIPFVFRNGVPVF